jgi:type II secretion system protein G
LIKSSNNPDAAVKAVDVQLHRNPAKMSRFNQESSISDETRIAQVWIMVEKQPQCTGGLSMRKGFTLIELLIVVAIIAILAAIAVPNFLEAQTRAKVTRAKADIHSLVTALESYRTDNNAYFDGEHYTNPDFERTTPLLGITTPVAYMSALPTNPPFGNFASFGQNPNQGQKLLQGYFYNGGASFYHRLNETGEWIPQLVDESWRGGEYFWAAAGPTRMFYSATFQQDPPPWLQPYDPTNGTVSIGWIVYLGPGKQGSWTSFN